MKPYNIPGSPHKTYGLIRNDNGIGSGSPRCARDDGVLREGTRDGACVTRFLINKIFIIISILYTNTFSIIFFLMCIKKLFTTG
jgi:hypothetical protein